MQLELFIYFYNQNNFAANSKSTLPEAFSPKSVLRSLNSFKLQASMRSIVITLAKLFE
jgi:hypothetical protein